jgi:KDO2-lipid IV(A) lauroyltransferase
MDKISFLIFLFFENIFSRLPLKILYKISNVIYFILNYIVKYREEVIYKNLRNSFPEKNEKEIIRLKKTYLKNICEMIVESIKIPRMKRDKLLEMVELKNIDLLNKLFLDGKSAFIALGHIPNWELCGFTLPLICKQKLFAVYLPPKNKYFDNYIRKFRQSLGGKLVPSKQVFKTMLENKNETVLTYILADQAPPRGSEHYWTEFLNQDTAFLNGLEKMAKHLGFEVVFMSIIKLKRGKYMIEFQLLTDNVKNEPENSITEKYARALEKLIINNPSNWLWSHKRWKNTRTA